MRCNLKLASDPYKNGDRIQATWDGDGPDRKVPVQGKMGKAHGLYEGPIADRNDTMSIGKIHCLQ